MMGYCRTINSKSTEFEIVAQALGMTVGELLSLDKTQVVDIAVSQKSFQSALIEYSCRFDIDIADSTNERYMKEIRDLGLFLVGIKGVTDYNVSEITYQEISQYFTFRSKKRPGNNHTSHIGEQQIKTSTKNIIIASLKSFFDFCADNNWLSKANNPMDHFKCLKSKREKVPSYLLGHEIICLLEVAKNKNRFALRDYTLVSVFIFTGARIEEVCNIRVADIDFEQNYITLHGVKGRGGNINERTIAMTTGLRKVLLEWVLSCGYEQEDNTLIKTSKTMSDYLFFNMTQKQGYLDRMDQDNARKIINRLFTIMNTELQMRGREPNTTGLTPHSLRHTFAILCSQAGVSVSALMELLGHNSLAATAIYTQIAMSHANQELLEYSPFINVEIQEFVGKELTDVLQSKAW